MTRHSLPHPALVAIVLSVCAIPLAQAEVDFAEDVWPFLEAKCVDCHRAPYENKGRTKNPKAGLRLDGDWAIITGSENGPVLTPGDPDNSYLLEVVFLPEEDDMFMPPKGDALTDEEKATFRTWIEEGASFGDWTGSQEGRPAEFSFEATEESTIMAPPESPYDALAEGLPSPPTEAVKAVTKAGGRVTPLAPGFPLVRVDFLATAKEAGNDAMASLAGIAPHIAQLDLSRTLITSAALAHLEGLENLRTLDLHSTAVSNDGLEVLAELSNLTYLNLYDTQVGDVGIAKLSGLNSLESIYLWNSEVTERGAAKLRKSLPDTEVSTE